MTKTEYLRAINIRISSLPQEEIDKHLDYYSELISDMIDDGMSEHDAVAKLGDAETVARDILCEQSLGTLVRASVRPKSGWSAMNIALLVVGSPIWLPIVISLLAAVFAVYVSLWSVIIALYGALLAIAVSAIGCVLAFVWQCALAEFALGLMCLGAGMVLAGLCFPLCMGVSLCAKWLIRALKAFGRSIKRLFIRKREA